MGVICNFIIWGLVALCVEAVPALWCTALLPCSGGNEAGRKCGLLYRVSQEECARHFPWDTLYKHVLSPTQKRAYYSTGYLIRSYRNYDPFTVGEVFFFKKSSKAILNLSRKPNTIKNCS